MINKSPQINSNTGSSAALEKATWKELIEKGAPIKNNWYVWLLLKYIKNDY